MMPSPSLRHDRDLFQVLLVAMRRVEPELRGGAMFGCPAAFLGRRMAFCVYGQGVGVKLPAAEVARLLAAGNAVAFTPYGKAPMKEWVRLQTTPATAAQVTPILTAALRYTRKLADARG